MQLSYRGKTHPMLRGEAMRGCRKKVRRGARAPSNGARGSCGTSRSN